MSFNASGIIVTLTVGEDVAANDVLYVKSDGKLWKADADAATTMPAVAMAVETIATDASGHVLLYGLVKDTGWTWTAADKLYVDTTTAGDMTATAPSGTGDQVQIVGIAVGSDTIIFNPNYILIGVE